jgi:hypothetical protein
MVRRKGANNQTAVKPASRLNCHPEMYISWGNNIFVRKLTFVQFTRRMTGACAPHPWANRNVSRFAQDQPKIRAQRAENVIAD